jgi:hypothetical protein
MLLFNESFSDPRFKADQVVRRASMSPKTALEDGNMTVLV